MPITRTPEEEVVRRHQVWAQALGPKKEPETLNVLPIVYLTDPVQWAFAGRMWEVPPIDVEDGFRVLELMERHKAEDEPADAEKLEVWAEDALAIIRKLVRPRKPSGPFARIRWWVSRALWRLGLTPHPWRRGTFQDIGEILGFFWMRRTKPLGSAPFGLTPTRET